MTGEEAKVVICNFLNGKSNLVEYLDALNTAEEILGIDCTLAEIDRWAHGRSKSQKDTE